MRMWHGAIVHCLLWLLLLGSTPLVAAGFAYGVNGEDFSLSTYRVEADGRLRHLGHQPIDKASSMAVRDPSGRFLLTVSNTTDRVSVFRLNPVSGAAVPVPGSPFRTGTRSPFSLQFHPSGRFLYLGVRFGGVGAMAFDAQSGALKPLPGSPFPAQRRTRELVVHPSGRFLYAVNAYSNSVSAYAIDERNGALHELPGSPYAVGDFGKLDYLGMGMLDVPPEAGGLPHAIAVDPAGHFVLVVNKAGASISVFRVDAQSGALALVPGSPFFCGFAPYRLAVHPSGRFVYVTLWGSGELAALALDGDSGRLSPIAGSPFALGSASPVSVNFNRDASQLYVSNYDSNEIILFDIDPRSGAVTRREALMTRLGPWWLTLVPGQAGSEVRPAEVPRAPDGVAALAVAPNGRYAYGVNPETGTVYAFVIDAANGNLSPLEDGVVPAGRGASDVAIDANGWYLYTSNTQDNTLSVFYLDPDSGRPLPVRSSPRRTGRQPVAVRLDPAARYAFVVNAGSNDISVYRFISNVSPLMFEAAKYGSPFPAGAEPRDLAVHPTGRFVYVANAGSGDVSAYRLHRKTGALNAMPGSPFNSGNRPVSLAVHPNGRYLYVANAGLREIAVFAIEAELGALARIASVTLPMVPESLRLAPQGDVLSVRGERGDRLLRYRVDAASGTLSALKP